MVVAVLNCNPFGKLAFARFEKEPVVDSSAIIVGDRHLDAVKSHDSLLNYNRVGAAVPHFKVEEGALAGGLRWHVGRNCNLNSLLSNEQDRRPAKILPIGKSERNRGDDDGS